MTNAPNKDDDTSPPRTTMTAAELRAALASLDWSQEQAASELGVPGGQPRISEWTRAERPIPPYIAAAVRTHLALAECLDERSDA